MADSWYPISSYRAVLVMSPTTVLDVEVVTSATIPTGVTFTYRVPYESWKEGAAGGLLDVIAVQIEEMVAGNHVVAGAPAQDQDASGLLVDYTDLIVEYDRGAQGLPPLQGTARVPMQNYFAADTGIGGFTIPGVATPAELVNAEYQRLAALAGQ